MDNKNNENNETTEWKIEDINAEDDYHQTLLDHMIYESRPSESIEKLIKAGGESGRCDGELVDLILERVTAGYRGQISEYGEKNIQNNIENLVVLLNNGHTPGSKNLNELLSNPELFEKYPETMKKILRHDKKLIDKLNSVKERRELRENHPQDPLEERLKGAKEAISEERCKMRRDGKRFIRGPLRNAPELGKTGNSSTGEVTEIHKKAAKIQTDVAKSFMMANKGKTNR